MIGQPLGPEEHFERRALHSGVGFPFQARMLEQMVDLVNDPHANVGRLGALLGWNPLLARMIALRASDYHDLPGRVSNVHLALALLGSNTLRETLKRAVATGANRHMTHSFHYCEELWNHSLSCALVAKTIAKETGVADPEVAFIAGLVHDVGFLFLGNELPSAESTHVPGWNPLSDSGKFRAFVPPALHEEAGSWMLERWETIPVGVLEAVRYHHAPMKARHAQQLTAVIHVADALCHHTFGGPMRKLPQPLQVDQEALALIGSLRSDQSAQVAIKAFVARIRRASPALNLKVRVLQQRLLETLEELPERGRFLLALHYYEGISFKGIAGILGVGKEEVTRCHADAFDRFQKVLLEVGEVL
jgi:HD-like signal output (HDOD) protein